MEGKGKIHFVAVKIYYRPKELEELLDMPEKEIVRFAYGVGALYKVENVRLVNLPLLMDYLKRYRSLLEEAEGTYMELDDAVKNTGLSAELIIKISASASALYEVGTFKIIEVKKLDDYIRSFPVELDMDDLEAKRIRGSKFVREIYKNK